MTVKQPLCNGDGKYDSAIVSNVPTVGFDGKPYERQVVRWFSHPCPGCDACKKEPHRMTTPTLLDAARAVMADVDTTLALYSASEAEGGIFSALRAAIAREEERQEIIEGLVEAVRTRHSGLCVPSTREGRRGCLSHMVWWPDDGPTCGYDPIQTALARYDAMKEDARG